MEAKGAFLVNCLHIDLFAGVSSRLASPLLLVFGLEEAHNSLQTTCLDSSIHLLSPAGTFLGVFVMQDVQDEVFLWFLSLFCLLRLSLSADYEMSFEANASICIEFD